MFTVKSDQQFFERFEWLSLRVRELSYLFQNGNVKVSEIEIAEWNTIASKLQADISQSVKDANGRFVNNDY